MKKENARKMAEISLIKFKEFLYYGFFFVIFVAY